MLRRTKSGRKRKKVFTSIRQPVSLPVGVDEAEAVEETVAEETTDEVNPPASAVDESEGDTTPIPVLEAEALDAAEKGAVDRDDFDSALSPFELAEDEITGDEKEAADDEPVAGPELTPEFEEVSPDAEPDSPVSEPVTRFIRRNFTPREIPEPAVEEIVGESEPEPDAEDHSKAKTEETDENEDEVKPALTNEEEVFEPLAEEKRENEEVSADQESLDDEVIVEKPSSLPVSPRKVQVVTGGVSDDKPERPEKPVIPPAKVKEPEAEPEPLPKVLVIHGAGATNRLIRETLENFGLAEVETCPDAVYGFELALKRDYQLFIFALHLPLIEGALLYELISKATQFSGSKSGVAPGIVFIRESHDPPPPDDLNRDARVKGFLMKPLKIERMLQVVRHALPKKGKVRKSFFA